MRLSVGPMDEDEIMGDVINGKRRILPTVARRFRSITGSWPPGMDTDVYSSKFVISSNFLGDVRPSTQSHIALITPSYLQAFRLARNCGEIKLEATAGEVA